MIQIDNFDSPITAAEKIIHGTRPYYGSEWEELLLKALEVDESKVGTTDMYTLEELKEIANYLIVYCEAHKEGD